MNWPNNAGLDTGSGYSCHARGIAARAGGLDGPVDENALRATLARPQQLDHYSNPVATLPQLAAAYGFDFAKNHYFRDGNKRIALVVVDIFLQMNGYERLPAKSMRLSFSRPWRQGSLTKAS